MEKRVLNVAELAKLNKMIRETLDDYYQKHDADSFFCIVDMYNFCNKQNYTTKEIPDFIEMQNVIVMG